MSVMGKSIEISAPPTPSSLPFFIEEDDYNVEIFKSHDKANAKFVSGKSQVLVTGFNAAFAFRKQNIPIKVISVSFGDLSYFISDGFDLFASGKNFTVSLPFKNSPLDTQFKTILSVDNELNKRCKIVYNPFQASRQLLKRKKIDLTVLPEPLASKAVIVDNLKRVSSINQLWHKFFQTENGVPKTAVIVRTDILSEKEISEIKQKLKKHAEELKKNPKMTIKLLQKNLKLTEKEAATVAENISINYLFDEELVKNASEYLKSIKRENDFDKDLFK